MLPTIAAAVALAAAAPPSSPPPASPPTLPGGISAISNFFHQVAGALLTMIGVTITVVGFHGMKVWGGTGRGLRCTMDKRWYGALSLLGLGQFFQLIAVELATEPVVAAVANFAIIVNVGLAVKLHGEVVTRADVSAICVMILSLCFVVYFTPQPPQNSLKVAQLGTLFTQSPLPAIGLIATTVLAALALPSALSSALRPSAHASPAGGVAFGLLAGYSGATSITAAKLCWLLFDYYYWGALALGVGWALSLVALFGEIGMLVAVFKGARRGRAARTLASPRPPPLSPRATRTLHACHRAIVVRPRARAVRAAPAR